MFKDIRIDYHVFLLKNKHLRPYKYVYTSCKIAFLFYHMFWFVSYLWVKRNIHNETIFALSVYIRGYIRTINEIKNIVIVSLLFVWCDAGNYGGRIYIYELYTFWSISYMWARGYIHK